MSPKSSSRMDSICTMRVGRLPSCAMRSSLFREKSEVGGQRWIARGRRFASGKSSSLQFRIRRAPFWFFEL